MQSDSKLEWEDTERNHMNAVFRLRQPESNCVNKVRATNSNATISSFWHRERQNYRLFSSFVFLFGSAQEAVVKQFDHLTENSLSVTFPLYVIGHSRMALAAQSHGIVLLSVLLLGLATPTCQYVYSCNTTATCGCSNSAISMTRIVGGETAATSSWGWAVSLSIRGTYQCGGAILSSTWIITAAHCVTSATASQITVFAGSNIRFSGQSRVGSFLTVHSNYNRVTNENDIALLQLARPLNMLDPNVKFICMPAVSSDALNAGEWPPAGLYVSDVAAHSPPMEDNYCWCSFRSLLSDGVHWLKAASYQWIYNRWLFRPSIIRIRPALLC